MKKIYLFWALLCLFFSPSIYAQPELFTGGPGTQYEDLDDQQKEMYDKLVPQRDGVEAYIMQYNPNAVFEEEGYVRFNIGLPHIDSLLFKMTWTDYTSEDRYFWAGEYYNIGRGAAITYSKLSFSKYYDTISGSIDLHGGSYSIGFLGNEQYVLYGGLNSIDGDVPISHNVDSIRFFPLDTNMYSPGAPAFYCSGRDSLRVLFIFTQSAADLLTLGIQTYAMNAVAALNQSFANSGISRRAYLARAMVIPALNDNLINVDLPPDLIRSQVEGKLRGFMFHPGVQSLRDIYKSDMVLFGSRDIGGDIGFASGIGSNFDSAYAGVLPMDNNRFTPAHEMGHLLGCQHDTAAAAPGSPVTYNHGYHFTGVLDNQHYYTLMAYAKAGIGGQIRLERFSSPDTSFMGTVTGTSGLYNNTRRVKEWLPKVSGYYSDENAFGVGVQISGTIPHACRNTGTATVVLPQGCYYGPYTYQWSYSDNGFNWHTIVNSNTSSVTTTVLPVSNAMPSAFQNRLYRVKVTTPLGASFYGSGSAVYSCAVIVPGTGFSGQASLDTDGEGAMLEVFPNPAAGSFKISIQLPAADEIALEIYDVSGKRVQTLYNGVLAKGYYQFPVNKFMAAGHYKVVLKGKEISASKPLIID